jgi:hypothetical protein
MRNACEIAARRCWENMVSVCSGGFYCSYMWDRGIHTRLSMTKMSSWCREVFLSQARSHLHSDGPYLSQASFITPVFLHAHVWELFLVGDQCDNTWSKLQIFKLTSLSLFPSWFMEFLLMSKELNDLSDWVLSHWYPTWKRSHAGADKWRRQ